MGNTSISSSRSPAARASAGRIQRKSTHSAPSHAGSAPGGASATKNQVSKRTFTSRGVIQRENGTGSASPSRTPASSSSSRTAVAAWSASSVVRGAAGEDPGAAHEALLGVALDQQHLGPVVRVAQQDQRGRLARHRGRARIELLAGGRPVDAHGASLTPPPATLPRL